jgi:hypothetical protein
LNVSLPLPNALSSRQHIASRMRLLLSIKGPIASVLQDCLLSLFNPLGS